MSAIPEDIENEAARLCEDNLGWPTSEIVMKVILAERQRCADVAKNWRRKKLGRDLSKAYFDPCGRWEGGEIYEEGKEKDLIAAAILSGT